ncbi:hypothetical protein KEM56_007244 [Ascosphaera pollenicola]|nr:hypothetical protein KEM56_007244 [Ascosphaera pollenicola]
MYFQSKRAPPTSMPIPFQTKAAPTTSLSPEDSTSRMWSGHSSTFTSSSWATCNSSLPTPPPPSVCGSDASTVISPRKSCFSVTPEETRPNISCAFPSWPSRTALFAENESASTPNAYISDEDLLWSCTPSQEIGTPGCIGGNEVSTAYQPVSPAPEAIDPRVAAVASSDEDEQARKFRAAQKHAMKLAQMAMIAAAEQRGAGGKRRKATRVVVADRRRRTPAPRRA